MISDKDLKDVENWFCYHAPVGNQVEKYTLIRDAGLKVAIAMYNSSESEPFHAAMYDLCGMIEELCPDSIERSYALYSCDQMRTARINLSVAATMLALRFHSHCPS